MFPNDGKHCEQLQGKILTEFVNQMSDLPENINTVDDLIAAIYATEGNSDMVSGSFGPQGFEGKIVKTK